MSETKLWNTLTIIVALLTAVVPAYVTYDLYGRGPTPEKRIELNKFLTINPMSDLSILGDKIALSLKVEDQVINNLLIKKALLRNIGSSPVLPSDYYENLSINVETPWKIVAVENSRDFAQSPVLRWKRVSDTRFEAAPALLNPGDVVSTNVYLTDVSSPGIFTKGKQLDPRVEMERAHHESARL